MKIPFKDVGIGRQFKDIGSYMLMIKIGRVKEGNCIDLRTGVVFDFEDDNECELIDACEQCSHYVNTDRDGSGYNNYCGEVSISYLEEGVVDDLDYLIDPKTFTCPNFKPIESPNDD